MLLRLYGDVEFSSFIATTAEFVFHRGDRRASNTCIFNIYTRHLLFDSICYIFLKRAFVGYQLFNENKTPLSPCTKLTNIYPRDSAPTF